MLRPLLLGLWLLAVARVAAADATAMSAPAADASATKASATAQSAETSKHREKKDRAEKPAADTQAGQPGGDVKMSGMSILGNEDAPKSLVLVPWKSSQLGDMPSVSRLLDSGAQPVDKDVFMRELSYYEYESRSK